VGVLGRLHLVGNLFPHINDDARSKSHQICVLSLKCRVLSRFVTRCVECRGGCVWLFLVGFLYSV